jgi:hypothetical protein
MHPSLSGALTSLDEYIAYLVGIRSQLAQGGMAKNFMPPAAKKNRITVKTPSKKRSASKGSGRKDEVAKFIKTNGPSKRSDILAGTKVPMGTLAYALNDKTMFKRLPDGKWDVAA